MSGLMFYTLKQARRVPRNPGVTAGNPATSNLHKVKVKLQWHRIRPAASACALTGKSKGDCWLRALLKGRLDNVPLSSRWLLNSLPSVLRNTWGWDSLYAEFHMTVRNGRSRAFKIFQFLFLFWICNLVTPWWGAADPQVAGLNVLIL